MRLVAATYNVHRCVGLDGRRSLARVTQVIDELDADIIGLQEVSTPDALAETARGEMLFGETMPGYGNAVLSRLPMRHIAALDLSYRGNEPRGALHVEVNLSDGPLQVIAAHLGLRRRERITQINEIIRYAAPLERVLVLGDFNEWRSRKLRIMDRALGASAPLRTFPSYFPLLPLDRIWLRGEAVAARIAVHKSPLARVASDHLPLRMVIGSV